MKKVLFIEYVLETGHVNYNRIHIDALMAQGTDVHLVLHQFTKDLLPYPDNRYALVLPHCLYQRQRATIWKPIINRIVFLITLIYIRIKVSFKSYDKVILSGFDELSLGIFPLCKNMYLTCHRNAAFFNIPLKRFILKRLARKNRFLVFNEDMKRPFLENGISKVDVVSHGCISPYTPHDDIAFPVQKDGYDMMVFHPSNSCDKEFMLSIVQDARFQDFLKHENILFVLRDIGNFQPTSNIRIIKEAIPFQVYQQQFLASDVILVAYPDDFRYRVSGVSYECAANGKRMLAKKLPALEYCESFFNYSPFFSDVDELCSQLRYLKENPQAQCIATSESLRPDYAAILS